jgi:hypothetical protein
MCQAAWRGPGFYLLFFHVPNGPTPQVFRMVHIMQPGHEPPPHGHATRLRSIGGGVPEHAGFRRFPECGERVFRKAPPASHPRSSLLVQRIALVLPDAWRGQADRRERRGRDRGEWPVEVLRMHARDSLLAVGCRAHPELREVATGDVAYGAVRRHAQASLLDRRGLGPGCSFEHRSSCGTVVMRC